MYQKVATILEEWAQRAEAQREEGARALSVLVDSQTDETGRFLDDEVERTARPERSARTLLQLPEAYREAAEHAIENEQIPAGYRDQVRQYFDANESE